MPDLVDHVFAAIVSLPDITQEQAKELNRDLQIAIYDILDDSEIDYSSLVLKVINADEVIKEWEQGKDKIQDPTIGGFRGSDPDTSRKGAIDVYPRSGSYRYKALIEIAKSGDQGLTYHQVEEKTGLKSVWKRLSELRDGGWIYEAGERLVQTTGSMATIWKITPKAERHIETKERAGIIR